MGGCERVRRGDRDDVLAIGSSREQMGFFSWRWK
jgi:hypothetical protein